MKPSVPLSKLEEPSLLTDLPPRTETSEKRERIGEWEGKTLYHSGKPDLIIQEFPAGSAQDAQTNAQSGTLSALRNEISSYLFEYIEGFHIPTHFVSKFSSTAMVVKRLEMLPLTVRIYNSGIGALMKRFSLEEGMSLDFPVIEHYYTGPRRVPAWVNEYHIYAFNIASPDEFKQINRMASKVNAVLRGLCDRRQLVVADVQFAFGRFKDQILLGDELSPFTCHFLDSSRQTPEEQDRFLPDQRNAVEGFMELHGRLMSKA